MKDITWVLFNRQNHIVSYGDGQYTEMECGEDNDTSDDGDGSTFGEVKPANTVDYPVCPACLSVLRQRGISVQE